MLSFEFLTTFTSEVKQMWHMYKYALKVYLRARESVSGELNAKPLSILDQAALVFIDRDRDRDLTVTGLVGYFCRSVWSVGLFPEHAYNSYILKFAINMSLFTCSSGCPPCF